LYESGGAYPGSYPLSVGARDPRRPDSPSETTIALVNPRRIVVADEGLFAVETTRHAAVEMSDTPVGGARPTLSLWQSNMRGVLVERFINWRALSDAAVVISNVNY
jgi:hypothetical protein